MIASIRGKKPHVYRVIILKQMADHSKRTEVVIYDLAQKRGTTKQNTKKESNNSFVQMNYISLWTFLLT